MKRRPIFYSLLPLLILALIVIGVYLSRDVLKQQLLTLVSERLQLSELDVRGLKINADGMHAESIHVSRQDGRQQLNLVFEDVKLGFSVLPLDLSSLVVARGKLDVALATENRTEVESSVVSNAPTLGGQTETSTTVTTALLPAQLIDLESIQIDTLTASVQLSDNPDPVGFIGSAHWTSDGDQVSVALENELEVITINSDVELRRIDLQIEHPIDATGPTRVSVSAPFTSKPQFSMTVRPANLENWITTSMLVPAQLRDTVAQFKQSMDGFSISSADVELTGGLDLEAQWPLRPVTIQLSGSGLGRRDCQFNGNVSGTLSTTGTTTGTFTVDNRGSISTSNCINQASSKSSSSVNVIPSAGFTITYDLSTKTDPLIDAGGPVELDLELHNVSANFSSDDLRITDAWREEGFPGAANGSITTAIELREFSSKSGETAVNAARVEVAGTVRLSQSSPGAPYDLRSEDLWLNVDQFRSSQPKTNVEARRVEASGSTSLQLTPSVADSIQLNGVIDLSTDMTAREITLHDSANDATVAIDDAAWNGQFKGNMDNGKTGITAFVNYQAKNLSLREPVIDAEAVTGDAQLQFGDTFALDTTVSITNVRGAAPLPPMAIQQIDGNLKLSTDAIDGNGTAALTADLDVPWTLTKRQNRIVVGTSMIASAPTLYEWLVPALGDLPQSVRITAGRVRLDSELEIENNNKSMVAMATVNDLSGGFEEIKFNQASVTMNATDLLSQLIDLKVAVADGKFANGTTFSDLSSDVRIAGTKVTIDRFAIRSFDADFHYRDLVIGDQSVTPATVITVDGLDLSAVSSELAKEQISASGKLSGQIPFRITENSVAIDDGRLESDGTGTIAYRSGGAEQNIEGLNNIALQALENFQYDKVELNLAYTEEGEYLAGLRLSGNNPQLYDGYPIVLNLNINGQLPGLLRSSLIGGNFNEEILRSLPQDPTRTEN